MRSLIDGEIAHGIWLVDLSNHTSPWAQRGTTTTTKTADNESAAEAQHQKTNAIKMRPQWANTPWKKSPMCQIHKDASTIKPPDDAGIALRRTYIAKRYSSI